MSWKQARQNNAILALGIQQTFNVRPQIVAKPLKIGFAPRGRQAMTCLFVNSLAFILQPCEALQLYNRCLKPC